jgi:cytochrome c oxidase subunit 3/cytochrome o ubiquinol oxidase subunit 3
VPPTMTGGHAAPGGHDLPMDNRKIGLWLFIASEVIFFAGLISAYLLYVGRPDVEKPHISVALVSVNTFILIVSSLCMVLALGALQRGSQRGLKLGLLATMFFGLVFLGGQAYEFATLFSEGVTPTSNLWGTAFFTLTGFHGAHVAIGVLWLSLVLIKSFGGSFSPTNYIPVEAVGLYWHFVDVVWIMLFTIIYLI